MRVLVVEDEPKMGRLLKRGFGEEGHADVAPSGAEALWMAASTTYDAIVLDVMLPGRDGFATCRELRSRGIWTPVLLLTARDAVSGRVEGLDTGADDYLVKPFLFDELLARLRTLVRRAPGERPTTLQVDDLRLDPAERRAGETLSRVQLLDGASDMAFESRSKARPAGAEAEMSEVLRVNPIACTGHGLCAELLPERISSDDWGYPIIDPRPITPDLEQHARRAVDACPTHALLLARTSKERGDASVRSAAR